MDQGVEHYARILREKAAERGWTYDKHYGPHDLDNSHWLLPGSERVQDVARNLGIRVFVVPRIHNKQDSIEAARNFLNMCWIDEEHCAQGIRCLDSYCKEWDEKHGTTGHHTGAMPCNPEPAASSLTSNERYYRKPRLASAWAA